MAYTSYTTMCESRSQHSIDSEAIWKVIQQLPENGSVFNNWRRIGMRYAKLRSFHCHWLGASAMARTPTQELKLINKEQ
jgi:hypothetical protein